MDARKGLFLSVNPKNIAMVTTKRLTNRENIVGIQSAAVVITYAELDETIELRIL